MKFSIDSAQLDTLAPFGIVCSGDLVITQTGPSLRKALGGADITGMRLLDVFTIERPAGVTSAEQIRARAGNALILRARDHPIALRSQPICWPDDDRIVLFGSLALTSHPDIVQLGLGIADFAASDPTPDMLILKRTQERSLSDLATLNAELEASATRLRATNAALAQAELRYRTLVEQHPLVTYVNAIDADGASVYISPQITSLLGYSPLEWQSDAGLFARILHPDDRDRVLARIRQTNEARASSVDEYRLITRDGRVAWFRDESILVSGVEGTPLQRQGYLLDITARRAAESELRETEARLRGLIASLRMGILLEDEHRRVALTNHVFCTDFEIPAEPDQLIGADCRESAERSKHLAADPEGFVTRIDEILRRREAVYAEEVEFANGRVLERDFIPIVVGNDYRGHLWTYRDVTPRIEAQREIERAHDEAVAASRAKTEFLSTVSHEIRTPMHGVLGTVDLLEQTSLDDDQAELLAIVKNSASTLLAVINDILDLQKAESGRIELALAPVDVPALMSGVIDVVRPQAEAKGIELIADASQEIPNDLVGDPGRLRQVLLNLLANAVKFTTAGKVSVSILLHDLDESSASLELVVADTGMGISADSQERIFEPFTQGSPDTEGTGLGLTITKQLVELMGGAISLESEPGRGTTVTAVVTLGRGGTATEAERTRPPRRPGLTGTVLVAEDSAVNRELAARQLSILGLTSRVVTSGAAAVEALQQGRYDLVLMDLQMPELNGIEATRAIRADEQADGRPRTPIIAVTANAMSETRAACLAAGMDDFATKPLLLDELVRVLELWLPRQPPHVDAPARRPAPSDDTTATICETLDALADELQSVESARRVVELWLAELPERLDRLRAAAQDRASAEELQHLAHTLKSTSALVGARLASELAAGIESRAAGPSYVTVEEVEELASAAEHAARAVAEWCERTASAPSARRLPDDQQLR